MPIDIVAIAALGDGRNPLLPAHVVRSRRELAWPGERPGAPPFSEPLHAPGNPALRRGMALFFSRLAERSPAVLAILAGVSVTFVLFTSLGKAALFLSLPIVFVVIMISISLRIWKSGARE